MRSAALSFLILLSLSGSVTAESASENVQRGNSCWKEKDYGCSIVSWNKAIALDPELEEQVSPYLAAAYAKRGAQYYLDKKYNEAVSDFDRSLNLDPDNAETKKARRLAEKGANWRPADMKPDKTVVAPVLARPVAPPPAGSAGLWGLNILAIAGVLVTAVLTFLGLFLARRTASQGAKGLARIILGFGICGICFMFVSGFDKMRVGKQMTGDLTDNTALMQSILRIEDDGVTIWEYDPNGYNKAGYNKDGYNRGGCNKDGYCNWRLHGNAVNCKGNYSSCNWYDAMAYCGGRLLTMTQLEAAYKAECKGKRRDGYCGYSFWSSEECDESGRTMSVEEYGNSGARSMDFYWGSPNKESKASVLHVRCVREGP